MTHALYRFYAADGTLLYVGITLNPGTRWKAHAKDKPWWTDVAQVTVENYPNRATVLEAERAAIIAERPRHNVIHNRGTADAPIPTPVLDRIQPIQPGDWAALGLRDGRCPVGGIVATDEIWVSIRLKDFWEGGLTHHVVAVRWDEIERIELAYPEHANRDPGGSENWRDRAAAHMGVENLMDDRHLGEFQTAWRRTHFDGDGRDPVEQARLDYVQELRKDDRG